MTRFPRIKYRIQGDDCPENLYDAYLIDRDTAIHYSNFSDMMIFGVVKSDDEPGVYLSYTGSITLGYGRSRDDIGLVVDRLQQMSAYELVKRFMIRSRQPFSFNITEMQVVDPSPNCGGSADE
ncbi:hypothetical protein [Brevibacillus borstelensis]|uniref:hypothetical protein n=1 Tax=Brevibacillus borstelensis TaxID=45462 RepID=UPI00046A4EFD|nr:hypothetical protein [Brevibacillus borstelensis]MCC0566539.1 hypothetical protein [Brevibacillus borstelensis]MCM3473065.1 hypothetical protein [Brevibacillus borstelensis]MCM3561691.1 hypothetical protein [Brevibacillus borstelensis]MED1852993.1 hypothetical protein [Brevibacillus borstelensis]